MRILSTALVLAALAVAPALANDTMSTLGAGGLVFVQTDDVKMLSEDLYVSPEQVRVKYEFRNEGAEDTDALVAFPMPDITGSGDFMVAIPTEDPENIFGFETLVNGEPVAAELHQYVFATNIDYTQYLTDLGLPLTPYGDATVKAINALDAATKQELLHRALVIPMEFDQGQGMQTEYWPVWTLRSTYSWEAQFPAGETVTVEHQYKPSVGGTVAVTFLSPPYEGYDPAVEYKRKYCTDDGFINTVKKTLPNPDEPYGAPFTESWVSYIWSTGANWAGPVGKFHLTIDKVLPQNLVSFCWDGEVKKTGPTTFEMEAEDWWPPYNRELEVLILNRQNPEPNVG
ncbi:MAG TPA: DUF4424 domain-containing protein [Devosia sp.]|jgi:hypothetical protein|uniref:DUF4424 domain-containing protein n=1 Tax=Devosia sp. TaxID=1871048 RepID=UPI002DDD8126|nr:DUF4424 domain-containing protein [Devosia sp.]HEV2515015.1 DUF4424 domain-containing protein [Devosia sp.]